VDDLGDGGGEFPDEPELRGVPGRVDDQGDRDGDAQPTRLWVPKTCATWADASSDVGNLALRMARGWEVLALLGMR
jgi:hypothetical protein